MLCCLAAIAWLSAFQDARPESSRRGDDPTDVRQMFVPTEHIEKFRDPETTYQTMRYDAFLDLLRAADAALRSRRFVGPAAGSISGRVDPDGRRVVGTSTWSFPKGHNGSVELWPWNLRVLAIRERGRSQRPDWGLASEGALMVRGLTPEARQVDVDWELPGESLERRWTIRGQTPKCASSRLQIDFPSGWQAWAPNSSQTEGPSADTRRIETKSSGESTWQIEFVPPDALDVEKPLLSWRGESSFRFGPVRFEM